ncbi:MAG TPA: 50S ribosomal protein L22 [Phycisphaerales bacterium]|nr:50S ribosomal protein L22 [Phycisphaerales bacterium]
MLSATKLKQLCADNKVSATALAGHLARGGFDEVKACSAVKNWQRGLLKPQPEAEDIRRLATALNVERNELMDWRSSYRFAPMSARKVRLVTQLIAGQAVQDALDTLAFTNKRAASMVSKVLKAAVADADEQQADVDNLYVCEARVDEAGIRIGTKRWIAKDRGRAHPIRKKACHIHISVTEG